MGFRRQGGGAASFDGHHHGLNRPHLGLPGPLELKAQVALTGGEPLLHPELDQILARFTRMVTFPE